MERFWNPWTNFEIVGKPFEINACAFLRNPVLMLKGHPVFLCTDMCECGHILNLDERKLPKCQTKVRHSNFKSKFKGNGKDLMFFSSFSNSVPCPPSCSWAPYCPAACWGSSRSSRRRCPPPGTPTCPPSSVSSIGLRPCLWVCKCKESFKLSLACWPPFTHSLGNFPLKKSFFGCLPWVKKTKTHHYKPKNIPHSDFSFLLY